MITRLDSPEGVLALKAEGHITEVDYQQVVTPAIEAATEGDRKARLVYVLEPGSDMTSGAALADAKIGLEHFHDFARIALVTSSDVLRGLAVAVGWLIPGKVKGFDGGELDQAMAWAAAGD